MINKWSKILMKGHIACLAVTEDWTILFAAYTAVETPNAYQWARQSPEL